MSISKDTTGNKMFPGTPTRNVTDKGKVPPTGKIPDHGLKEPGESSSESSNEQHPE